MRLTHWLCSIKLICASQSIWERSYEAHPFSSPRDEDKDYFVADISDPANAPDWQLEEPMPIRDHWLFSVKKGTVRRSLPDCRIYDVRQKRLQKRAPVPSVEQVMEEFNITDPLFRDQWHIVNSNEPGHDMNVVELWRRNITGNGVTVAIVDDGLDFRHPDFARSFSKEGSWDYNVHRNLPDPELDVDSHGTRCAGEISADENSFCGVGIAPNAKVSGIRILSGTLLESDEARALLHAMQVNYIYSCSWGPSDDGKTIEGPPSIVKRAEVAGIEEGRGGLGSIYVVASGNGAFNGDNCNYDGYTNSIYSITVGAIDRKNKLPYYAESCSANMVVTYSSNYVDKITTSDRNDPLHPEDIKCTNQHSGTSAAAPIAAGVLALLLEYRPDLTWRDVQYLVRNSAKEFDTDSKWQTTADGKKYHNSFGYGLLDGVSLIENAKDWKLVKPQTWLIGGRNEVNLPIKNEWQEVEYEVTKEAWDSQDLERIEHVRVLVDYQHDVRGSLTFQLQSPSGILSELVAPRGRDRYSDPVKNWYFMSLVHWGENGVGTWKLRIHSLSDASGTLNAWQLKLFGEARDPSKVRRYSDVWDEYEPPAQYIPDDFTYSTTATAGEKEPESSSVQIESSVYTPIVTSARSSPSLPTATSPEKPSSGSEEEEHESSHHSLLFYLTVSAIGIAIIAIVVLPILWCLARRRTDNLVDPSDFALMPEDVELDNYNDDNYSIADSEDDDGGRHDDTNHDRSNLLASNDHLDATP